jgi:2-oxoglutarate ferredoxin oxidoreductase subunit beta
MIYYKDHSEIRNGADTKSVALEFQGKIVVGKFVDKERPTYLDAMNEHFQKRLGDRYVPSDEIRKLIYA